MLIQTCGTKRGFQKAFEMAYRCSEKDTALRSREMFERESTIVTGGEGVSAAASGDNINFDKHLIELLIICFYTTIHIN